MKDQLEPIFAGIFIGILAYLLLEAAVFKIKEDGWQFWKEWFK